MQKSESNNQQFILYWVDPETGQHQELKADLPISFGRHPDNTVALTDKAVSRWHAIIEESGDEVVLVDRNSKNGTLLNGSRCLRELIWPGDTITIGHYSFTLEREAFPTELELEPTEDITWIDEEIEEDMVLVEPLESGGEFPPSFIKKNRQISLREIGRYRHSWPVEQTTYLAIGGGLGSFAWTDHLRIYGVQSDQIVVIGGAKTGKPYEHYQRLCNNSQIPEYERLRSNSDSRPDNIWGWPGYAVQEIWQDLKRGDLKHAAKVSWQIFGEPTLAETYTPRSGDVFKALNREALRINWSEMYRFGRVRTIRQTEDNRYVVAYSQTTEPGKPQHKLIIAKYLHLALGYPAIKLEKDLQDYRDRYRDFNTIVNAYEDHDHVYRHLQKNGGTVIVRGRGIVASRVIQKLDEVRTKTKDENITIVHLVRGPKYKGRRFRFIRRPVKSHWEFQPFNWPKACWGGDLKAILEKANDSQRSELLNCWGGSTTAARQDWQKIVERGAAQGWYHLRFGEMFQKIGATEDDKVMLVIGDEESDPLKERQLTADFVIDATGLDPKVDHNPLLNDLVDRYKLDLNVRRLLEVTNDFEILKLRNGDGRVFASGIMTLGGPYAPVDSFLGLQYTAQRSVDALTRLGAPGLRYLNGLRSVGQWLKWMRGVTP